MDLIMTFLTLLTSLLLRPNSHHENTGDTYIADLFRQLNILGSHKVCLFVVVIVFFFSMQLLMQEGQQNPEGRIF